MLDRKTLIKNLSIGFLPLLVFIIVDAFAGIKWGLIIAVIFGIGETAFIYFREKRIDRFILFDTGLIVVLGLVSLLLENDIFFKIKPALIEAILAVLLGITAFSDNPLLLRMSSRYMKGFKFNEEQLAQMRIMMRRIFFVIAAHTILVAWSAFYLSTAAWGFISGGLFYIVMAGVMGVEFLRARKLRKEMTKRAAEEEWFDIVTPQGKIIGKAPRSAVHGNPKLLHPVVHVHIFNQEGDLFLQKRAMTKDLYPGLWDTAVGGHVSSGESIQRAVDREAEEELGLSMVTFKPIFRYVNSNEFESELVHGFILQEEGPFFINRAEIDEGRFWKIEEIANQLGQGIFTQNFEHEFGLLQKHVINPASRQHR